eukprot:3065756-Pleurochrysis_carterae.AAC.1
MCVLRRARLRRDLPAVVAVVEQRDEPLLPERRQELAQRTGARLGELEPQHALACAAGNGDIRLARKGRNRSNRPRQKRFDDRRRPRVGVLCF